MTPSEAGKLGAIKSAQIQKEQKELRIQEYLKNPTKCKFCQAILPYEKRHNKFCNASCAASFNNKLRPKEKNFCLNCGKEISIKGKFCNNKCQGKYRIFLGMDKNFNLNFKYVFLLPKFKFHKNVLMHVHTSNVKCIFYYDKYIQLNIPSLHTISLNVDI